MFRRMGTRGGVRAVRIVALWRAGRRMGKAKEEPWDDDHHPSRRAALSNALSCDVIVPLFNLSTRLFRWFLFRFHPLN